MTGLVGAQYGPWLTTADAGWVLAIAERYGFVREPSLNEAAYATYVIADAVEALGWLRARGLLDDVGLPVIPTDGHLAVDAEPAFLF